MAIYLTSDLHFNHNKEFIYKARGFETVDDMNKTIIQNWNSVIDQTDKIFLLGDVMLGKDHLAGFDLLCELKGQIHIVLGNHDSMVRTDLYRLCPNVVSISWAEKLDYKGYHFFMAHFPSMTANLEKESLKQCTCNLYGHTHQNTNFYNEIPFMYHVGVDSHNCYPVLLDDIIEDMKQKFIECKEEL